MVAEELLDDRSSSVDNVLYLFFVNVVRWRQQNVIAATPVCCTVSRIDADVVWLPQSYCSLSVH